MIDLQNLAANWKKTPNRFINLGQNSRVHRRGPRRIRREPSSVCSTLALSQRQSLTAHSASSRLRVCYPVVSALTDLLGNKSMNLRSTSKSDRAVIIARQMAQAEIDRTQPEVTRFISNHEAKPCRALFRDIEGRLPIELRKMIYGFIWQDQRVQLDTY